MRLILWRIPRTGTTSLRAGLKACGLTESGLASRHQRFDASFASDGHVRVEQVLERKWLSWSELQHTPQLIIVRHPAERLVSTWSLFQQSEGLVAERLHPNAPRTWDDYVTWCCTGPRAKEYHQINYQCWPAVAWFRLPLVDDPGASIWPNQWPPVGIRREREEQARIWDKMYVFHYEDLQSAWQRLVDLFDFRQRQPLPHVNGSVHGDALDAFTAKQREMVSKAYAWEMETFGYAW